MTTSEALLMLSCTNCDGHSAWHPGGQRDCPVCRGAGATLSRRPRLPDGVWVHLVCSSCPEFYDVYAFEQKIGSLRLRHSRWSATLGDGQPGCGMWSQSPHPVNDEFAVWHYEDPKRPDSTSYFLPEDREAMLFTGASGVLREWLRAVR